MRIKIHKNTLVLIALYLLDIIVLSTTNPNRLPLVFLIMPFVLMFLTILMSVYLLIKKLPLSFMSNKRILGLALLMAIFLVMLALFESIHQLTTKDLALSIIIVFAMGFYLTKAKFL